MREHVFVWSELDSDDRLGRLDASFEIDGDRWRGALVSYRGQFVWRCNHEPAHPSRIEARECARAEVRKRREAMRRERR